MQSFVERPCGVEITAEGFLDDDACVVRAAGLREALYHAPEQARRNGEIVDRTGGRPQRLLEKHECSRIPIVAIHVVQQRRQFCEALRFEVARRLHAVARAVAELVERPAGACHADDGNVQPAPMYHGVQRGKNLLIGEISGRAEKYESIRFENVLHRRSSRNTPALRPESSRRSASSCSISSSANATPGRLISRSRCRRNAVRARRSAVPAKRHCSASAAVTLSTPSCTSSTMYARSTAHRRLSSSTLRTAYSSNISPVNAS